MADTKPISMMYVVLRKSDRAPYQYCLTKEQALQTVETYRAQRYGYGGGEDYLIVEYVPTRIIKKEEPNDIKDIEKTYSKEE